MNIRANILLRVYLSFGLIVLLAVAVLVRLCDVQFVEGHKWRAMADSLSTKYINVEAARGNIYSNDGSLLATSIPEYELRMDMYAGGISDNKLFYSKVDSLGMKLSQFFGDKTPKEYSRMLRTAREDSVRYLLIKRKVNYQDLKMIRTFPLYNIGKYTGGLMAIQQNKRIHPFKSLAARTIGYKNENVSNGVGLEGAFGNYINGESGKRLVQRIAGGVWMPIMEADEIAPKEGADIISTIDINMQDLAQSALERQLIASDADHGTVILMEVATGEVRAVANYTRESEGVYEEKFNYAIGGSQDPGSTFKLASYMAMLEDNKVDTNTMVATGDGTFKVYNKIIKDSHGGIGTVTVKKAFEESSNTAVAKLVYGSYKDNPSEFTDHLYQIHLNERLGLQIPGETKPVIKNPSFKSWSGLTLPQMAYGYEMQITPLQILALYNAVANNGKYIAPLFVKEIRRLGNPIEQFHARVIDEHICSDKTLRKLQAMLEGVVTEGTGKLMGSRFYRVAGKTGTAQVADGNKGYKAKKSYQASFCGYFPADKPKYSIMVSINGPKNGYYGATVAGPVFKEIADRIYASDIQMYNNVASEHLVGNTKSPEAKAGQSKAVKEVYSVLGIKALYAAKSDYFNSIDTSNGIVYEEYNSVKGMMPNVVGMGLKDALYLLGNAGLKTQIDGSGKVASQSIPSGTKIGKGLLVQLALR